MNCKRCKKTELIVKNGYVRNKQRFLCKGCGYNFVEGDERVRHENTIKRAFCILLYTMGKGTFNFMGKLFKVSPTAVYKWVRKEAERMQGSEISSAVREIEIDEMWHFIRSKKRKSGDSKRWIVVQGEPLPGLQAVVMLRPSKDYMKN